MPAQIQYFRRTVDTAVLGASWARLGASWGLPGASWSRPGPSWGRPGSHFGVIFSIIFRPRFRSRFGGRSRPIFEQFLEPSWDQKTTKNMGGLFKIKVSGSPRPTPIRDRFLMHFGSIFDTQNGPKSIPGWVLGRLGSILGRLGASWERLGASWGRLGPSWGHLGRVLGCLGGVLGRLGGVLGAS